MGAAWRDVKDRDLPKLEAMISGVKALGLETCATLGMLDADQAEALSAAGLDSTTTTSTPRRRTTPQSSPPGPIRTGSTRWSTCARRA